MALIALSDIPAFLQLNVNSSKDLENNMSPARIASGTP
jgi:hypothetical protein